MKVVFCVPTLNKREGFKFIPCEQKTSLQMKSRKTNNAIFVAEYVYINNVGIGRMQKDIE